MRRALLVLAALLGALALGMLLLSRRTAPALDFEPPPVLGASTAAEASPVQLSYVDLADSPHRSEQPGATQVYGWLTRASDGQPVRGGNLRLGFFDHSHSADSAAEEQARALAAARVPRPSRLEVPVQEDGGWYIELPGKAWIDTVEYTPAAEEGVEAELAYTGFGIDRALERGALQLSFRVDMALEARGIVVDELGEPVAGAAITVRAIGGGGRSASSAEDGGFTLRGITPQYLVVEHGMIRFYARADGFEPSERSISWEHGQLVIPPFRIVLRRPVR